MHIQYSNLKTQFSIMQQLHSDPSALQKTLIKTIAIAAGNSQLQSIVYDVTKPWLQLVCHLGESVSSVVHGKQTFLVVRQLKYIFACVCLQQNDIKGFDAFTQQPGSALG